MAKECSNTSCNKSSCEGCGQKQPQSLMAEPNVFSDVKHVIGVVSGKGGVGKSFVTGSMANLMASKAMHRAVTMGSIRCQLQTESRLCL